MPGREVDQYIDQLIALGEDKEELDFYREIFNDLDEPEQKAILDNLKQEIRDLSAAV